MRTFPCSPRRVRFCRYRVINLHLHRLAQLDRGVRCLAMSHDRPRAPPLSPPTRLISAELSESGWGGEPLQQLPTAWECFISQPSAGGG